MSGTELNLSLVSEVNRLPATQSLTVRGNHRVSAFLAPLAEISVQSGNMISFSLTPGDAYELLLFVQDMPTELEATSRATSSITIDDDAIAPHTLTFTQRPQFDELIDLIGDAASITNVLTLTGDVAEGQVMRGVTPSNGVLVDGYGAVLVIEDQGLLNVATPVLVNVFVECLTRCDVLDGFANQEDLAGAHQITVILNETQYTQAMADAGNQFTQTDGAVVHIVGIWGPPAGREGPT